MSITAMKTALSTLELAYDAGYTIECEDSIVALRTAIAEAEKVEPVAWYDEEMDCAYTASELDGGTADGLAPLFLAAGAQPESTLVKIVAEKIAGMTPTECAQFMRDRAAGAQPAPKQEPVAYLVYAKGSHKYMTLTFDTDKVPEIYKGGDVVALCAAGAQTKQVLENLDELSVGDSLFESWYASYVKEGAKGLKQHCRDAYAAGMGDPLVAPPQAQSDHIATTGKMVQPLTDDQIYAVIQEVDQKWHSDEVTDEWAHRFARLIETKIREQQ